MVSASSSLRKKFEAYQRREEEGTVRMTDATTLLQRLYENDSSLRVLRVGAALVGTTTSVSDPRTLERAVREATELKNIYMESEKEESQCESSGEKNDESAEPFPLDALPSVVHSSLHPSFMQYAPGVALRLEAQELKKKNEKLLEEEALRMGDGIDSRRESAVKSVPLPPPPQSPDPEVLVLGEALLFHNHLKSLEITPEAMATIGKTAVSFTIHDDPKTAEEKASQEKSPVSRKKSPKIDASVRKCACINYIWSRLLQSCYHLPLRTLILSGLSFNENQLEHALQLVAHLAGVKEVESIPNVGPTSSTTSLAPFPVDFIAEPAKRTGTLEYLDLSGTSFPPHLAQRLGSITFNAHASIVELQLAHCQIGDSGARLFLSYFPSMSHHIGLKPPYALRRLHLEWNQLTTDSEKMVMHCFPPSDFSTLEIEEIEQDVNPTSTESENDEEVRSGSLAHTVAGGEEEKEDPSDLSTPPSIPSMEVRVLTSAGTQEGPRLGAPDNDFSYRTRESRGVSVVSPTVSFEDRLFVFVEGNCFSKEANERWKMYLRKYKEHIESSRVERQRARPTPFPPPPPSITEQLQAHPETPLVDLVQHLPLDEMQRVALAQKLSTTAPKSLVGEMLEKMQEQDARSTDIQTVGLRKKRIRQQRRAARGIERGESSFVYKRMDQLYALRTVGEMRKEPALGGSPYCALIPVPNTASSAGPSKGKNKKKKEEETVGKS